MRYRQTWAYKMACCGKEVGRVDLFDSGPPQFEMLMTCKSCPAEEGSTSTAYRVLESQGWEGEE